MHVHRHAGRGRARLRDGDLGGGAPSERAGVSIQHILQWHNNSRRDRRQWQRRGRDRRVRRLDGRDRQVCCRRCGHRGLRIGERGEGSDGDDDVEEHYVFRE